MQNFESQVSIQQCLPGILVFLLVFSLQCAFAAALTNSWVQFLQALDSGGVLCMNSAVQRDASQC